ncbi:MAG: S8 family serine peptidase [Aureispira sp.]
MISFLTLIKQVFLTVFLSSCLLQGSFAQDVAPKAPQPTRYSLHCIYFKDKACQEHSVFRPQEFLSARALDRRQWQSILINEQDLPVCTSYCQQLAQLGAVLKGRSKWLNAVAVHTQDAQLLKKLAALSFVRTIEPLGFHRKAAPAKFYTKRPRIDSSQHKEEFYGLASSQIKQHQGHILHQLGYRGAGIHVAVIDAGFSNAYRMSVFDSAYYQDRLLGHRDFVEGDAFVYESSTHGNSIWSVMAANRPHLMVGTAPDASYYLLKAEDVRGEYPAEEFYWLLAAEFADSAGVDVINSSMGYHAFRNPAFSYPKKALNGQTTLISRAATWATAKGLFLVNAAGNEGHKAWKTLAAPADVEAVLTVGASTPKLQRANFSAVGPTADQRLKPDVAALGTATAYASMVRYEVGLGEGTSYACPVITGLVTALKQAYPKINNTRLRQVIRESGHQAQQPDTLLGYGLPNFWNAYQVLADSSIFINKEGEIDQKFRLINQQLHVYVEHTNTAAKDTPLQLQVMDLEGNLCGKKRAWLRAGQINKISLGALDSCGRGVFALRLDYAGKTHWLRLLR